MIAFFALLALGAWFLGPVALRVGGVLLILKGLFTSGDSWLWVLLGLSVAAASQWVDAWLDEVKRRMREAAMGVSLVRQASQSLDEVKRRMQPPASRAHKVGGQEQPCPKTGKVKFLDKHRAWQEVERNQDLYDRGLENRYRLERAYPCEFCGWWHTTSKAKAW